MTKKRITGDLDEQLLDAAITGDADSCQRLLEHGANVHAVDEFGWSALHRAAWVGHVNICLMLLAHDADPQAKDVKNQTARELAIDAGHEGCAYAMDVCEGAQAARAALQEVTAGTSCKGVAP